jgi:hypothetical protein
MPALLLLSLALLLTLVMAIDRRYRRRRAHTISEVGRPARMHYSAVDRFGLTPRLIAAPSWRGLAPGIEVKDVLYASAGGERCFILTAKSRMSPDARAIRTLVRFVESTADGTTRELAMRHSASVAADVDGYRELIEGWQQRHADAPSITSR